MGSQDNRHRFLFAYRWRKAAAQEILSQLAWLRMLILVQMARSLVDRVQVEKYRKPPCVAAAAEWMHSLEIDMGIVS